MNNISVHIFKYCFVVFSHHVLAVSAQSDSGDVEPRLPRYEAPSMSVKRARDWSVTAPRRAVRVSEACMGLVNGRDALPPRSR